jgi:hypothetical protein
MPSTREIGRSRLSDPSAARLSLIAEHDQVLLRIFEYPHELINWPKKLSLLLEKREKNNQFNAKIYWILFLVSLITWSLSILNILYENSFDYALEQPQARADADRDFMAADNMYCAQINCGVASFFNITIFFMVVQSLCIFPVFFLFFVGLSVSHYLGEGFYYRDKKDADYKKYLPRLVIVPYHLLHNVIPALLLASLDISGFVITSRDLDSKTTIQNGYDWAYHQQFGLRCAADPSLLQCFLDPQNTTAIIPQNSFSEINLMVTAMAASSKAVHLTLLALFACLMFLFSSVVKKLSPLESLFLRERIYNRSPYSEIRDAFSQPDLRAALAVFKPRGAPVLNITELNIGGVNDESLKRVITREFLSTYAYVRRGSALLAWSYGIPSESIIPVQEAAGAGAGAASGVARYPGVAAVEAMQPLLG